MHAITAMIVTLIIPLVLLATPGTSHGDRVGAETYEVQRGIQHTKDALGMEAHARPQTGGQFTATETGASAKTRRETGRHIEAETGASAKTRKETGRYTETETGASAKTRREIEIDARTEIRTGQGGEARSGDPWEGIDSGEGTATGAKASAWKARETETTVQTDTLAGRQTNTGGTGGEHSITWGRPNTQGAHFAPDTARQVTVMVGQRARLLCTVLDPDTRHVSWIRQRDLHIMTVGIFTYTRDDRFKVYHPEKSNDWHLDITSTTFRDAGVYECQVSTSPKISLPVTLTVQATWGRTHQNPRAEESSLTQNPPSRGWKPTFTPHPPSQGWEHSFTHHPPLRGWEPSLTQDPPSQGWEPSFIPHPPSRGWEPRRIHQLPEQRWESSLTHHPPSRGWEPRRTHQSPERIWEPSFTQYPPSRGWKPRRTHQSSSRGWGPKRTHHPPDQRWEPRRIHHPPPEQRWEPKRTYHPPDQRWESRRTHHPPPRGWEPSLTHQPPEQRWDPRRMHHPPERRFKPRFTHNPPGQWQEHKRTKLPPVRGYSHHTKGDWATSSFQEYDKTPSSCTTEPSSPCPTV